MRFLILTQYFWPEIGASQGRLAALAIELKRQGHDVEVVTAMPNHPTGAIFPAYARKIYCKDYWHEITIHRVWLYSALGAGLKRIASYLSFTITSLFGLMRAKRPDYIFVESPPLFLSFSAWLAAKIWCRPVIFNVADLWPDSVEMLGLINNQKILKLAKYYETWTYKHANYITAVTEGIRTTLINQKNIKPEKILFLPNGVDIDLYKSMPYATELAKAYNLTDKRVILYTGTIGYAHGLEFCIKAMQQLLTTHPQIHLVIIGEGSEKTKLEELLQTLNLTNVTILPACPADEISRFYSIAEIGLVSLRNNPLFAGTRSAKLFAIMGCGKAVLHFGSGEGAKLVEQAKAGVSVKAEDVAALSKAIQKLISEPKLTEELGQNGRTFVVENYSWQNIIQTWLNELNSKQNAQN